MTDLDREELRSDLEERRQMAEEAFEELFISWSVWCPKELRMTKDFYWTTVASEMGISDYYRKLKEGK